MRSLLLAGFLSMAVAGPASAEVPPYVASLNPTIVLMRVAGDWSTADDRGSSRLVLTRDPSGVMRLFVQWVNATSIVSTVEVEAIAARKLTVTSINVDSGSSESAVHLGLQAPDGTELEDRASTLIIRGPGDATIQAAGN